MSDMTIADKLLDELHQLSRAETARRANSGERTG